jgi:XRE family aerobic/anaerobic benzoate catabolism transcriptional regulator
VEIQAFLERLGQRLRRARELTGQSVTAAAREAGVSRRHWTETEAGRANPSILVLARQAEAVGVRLPELLEFLASGPRKERIALVGLRGAGKSTVGRRLALELEVPFVELDQRIEDLAGLTLGEIFDLHGGEVFHRLEAEALEAVLGEGERLVIATGGSIVASPATFQRLRETCRTVWLRAAPEEHYRRVVDQGDRRPMKGNPRAMEELREILARREVLYGRCDEAIDTTERSPEEVITLIRDPEAKRSRESNE